MDWGSDDEVEQVNLNLRPIPESTKLSLLENRPSNCGLLSFHKGTEDSMFLFLQQHRAEIEGCPDKILNAIDWFCYSRHWMMHVGEEKFQIIQNVLKEKQQSEKPLICVELGSYCGYSALVIGSVLRKDLCDKLYCIEINPSCVAWTERLVAFAGLSEVVTVVQGSVEGRKHQHSSIPNPQLFQLSSLITHDLQTHSLSSSKSPSPLIDVLFLDHDKPQYHTDLKAIEEFVLPPSTSTATDSRTLLGVGSVVVADNILSFGVPLTAYLERVDYEEGSSSPTQRYHTILHKGLIEYCHPSFPSVDPTTGRELNIEDGITVSQCIRT